METVRPCGCKGIRTCLICETEYNISKPDLQTELQKYPSYVYCPECDKCWPGWDANEYRKHPNHAGDPLEFRDVYIKLDFLTPDEGTDLMKSLDQLPWDASQSGRRKQNFGPKCNFKKRKVQLGAFAGFPKSTKFVQDKFIEIPLLDGFKTVEQCTLEYDPERGASIDPHIDDCWTWGERIVTVNVLGDSVLTMIPYHGPKTRYNLEYVPHYTQTDVVKDSDSDDSEDTQEDVVVRLPMPARSLMLLYGCTRYNWEHCVLRQDVKTRRVCLAYRELTPRYLESGEYSNETTEILEKASIFW